MRMSFGAISSVARVMRERITTEIMSFKIMNFMKTAPRFDGHQDLPFGNGRSGRRRVGGMRKQLDGMSGIEEEGTNLAYDDKTLPMSL